MGNPAENEIPMILVVYKKDNETKETSYELVVKVDKEKILAKMKREGMKEVCIYTIKEGNVIFDNAFEYVPDD